MDPDDLAELVVVYVELLDEGVDVWRPVRAIRLTEETYRIIEQPYDREIETWRFEPGDEVFCEMIEMYEGRALTATRRSPSAAD